jgi:hypothetical protein
LAEQPPKFKHWDAGKNCSKPEVRVAVQTEPVEMATLSSNAPPETTNLKLSV